ncbi:sugar phosphate isomerase/epimerase [Undibacterium sp. TS12]|uniref:sugar phosphate isomerase/epimerase family protein n=1 Tax=Undibacterium sp. TS12 TaxID=2908202 RepID=UPI001F4CB165|nr:sugar phosphate isomerase/epimerase [Undibacterium sp. TS12]MCH8620010.1 sugar phosphate isomerase/epimerase [Undibacterium sp. TS12]
MTAQVLIFAPHWGSAHLSRDAFITRVEEAGFDGIEMSLPMDASERDAWTTAIANAGLQLIAQQWETVFHSDFAAHKQALGDLLRNACAAKPLFVNTHTGKDFYNQAQNNELLDLADVISAETGVAIVHEIHRSRFSGHPMLLLPYLEQRPQLQLNADLSHWCCACESLLEDQAHVLEKVFPHVRHIHARVGHSQGPQVNDFRAPEHAAALQQHLSWWDAIVARQRASGAKLITLTPEFGPAPYTQTLPYTNQAVADTWELNVAMMQLLRERYAS